MPFAIRGEIEGLREVLANIAHLKESAQRKLLRPGVTKAARQVAKVAKSKAPVGATRLLRKSIGSKVKTYKGAVVGIVGPRKGYKQVIDGRPVDPVKYAHLTEGGRREVRPKSKKVLAGGGVIYGKAARAVEARRWLAAAWAASKAKAAELIADSVRDGLAKMSAARAA